MMEKVVESLACTGVDVLTNPELLDAIQAEFKQH